MNDSFHIYGLSFVFLPRVNRHLKQFVDAWNEHQMRTEGNMAPTQNWIHSSELYDHCSDDISPDFSIDWNGPMPSRRYSSSGEGEGIQIPEIQLHLNEAEEEYLVRNIDPLGQSENFGCDIFFTDIQVLNQIQLGRPT